MVSENSDFERGDIHIIPFPFTDLSRSKLRPSIIVGVDRDDITVVFITTIASKGNTFLPLEHTRTNGLKAHSYIRYTKIATLDKRISVGKLGSLTREQYSNLTGRIMRYVDKE